MEANYHTSRLSNHFHSVIFGGNWTSVNLNDTLQEVDWIQATAKIDSFNTIATLVYHINYYVRAVTRVLKGGALDAHDKYSFDCPQLNSQADWENLVNQAFSDAQEFTSLVDQLPDSILPQTFADEKYGSYHRNLLGIIEHTHYHLGQIVILKKLIASQKH